MNASWYDFARLESESKAAIREWLSNRPERDVELFQAIIRSHQESEDHSVVTYHYPEVSGHFPATPIVNWLLSRADRNDENKDRMLKLAICCVNSVLADVEDYWKVLGRIEREPEMAGWLEEMRICKIEGWRADELEWQAQRAVEQAAERSKVCMELMPLIPEILTAKRPGVLGWAAGLYFQKRGQGHDAPPAGVQGIVDASSQAIADAIKVGWRYLFEHDFNGLTPSDIGKIDAENRHYFVEHAAFAGLDMLFECDDVPPFIETHVVIAISLLRNSYFVQYEERRRRIEAWAIARLNHDAASGENAVLGFLSAALGAGATDIALINILSRSGSVDALITRVLLKLLKDRPSMPVHALRWSLAEVGKRLSIAELRALAQSALDNPQVRGKSKRLWQFLDFAIEPQKIDSRDALYASDRTMLATFDLVCQEPSLIDAFDFDDNARILRAGLIVSVLGRLVPPSGDYPAARHMRRQNREEVLRKTINQLGAMTDVEAGNLLSRLIALPELAVWRKQLMHAQFQHRRIARDLAFKYPLPQSVREALTGKAPVNTADLRAIVVDELHRLQRELRTSANSPWKHYWNTDGRSRRVTQPKIENHCRDLLLERLHDRLRPYGIAWAMAEMRHPEDTRADIAILSHAGKSLPIEIKRDSNDELWCAAETQLMRYAEAETAEQVGVYLVFWFDHIDSRAPSRPGDKPSPASADDLQRMLTESLADDVRDRIDVIVFDVSDPDRSTTARRRVPKRKKGSQTENRGSSTSEF